MARAHLYRPITDGAGNLRKGAVIRVLEPGTLTPIAESMLSSDTGTGTVENPSTNTSGIIDFYLAAPKRVRIGLRFPNEAERFFEDVDVILPFDAATGVEHDHPFASEQHTHSAADLPTTVATDAEVQTVADGLAAHLADTTDAHDASAISFVPVGDLTSTNVQAAIAELQAETLSQTEADALFLTHAEGDAAYATGTHTHTGGAVASHEHPPEPDEDGDEIDLFFQGIVPGPITVANHVLRPGLRMPKTVTVKVFVVRVDVTLSGGSTTVVARRFNNGNDTGDSLTATIVSGQSIGSASGSVPTAKGDLWKFDVTSAGGAPTDLLLCLDCGPASAP